MRDGSIGSTIIPTISIVLPVWTSAQPRIRERVISSVGSSKRAFQPDSAGTSCWICIPVSYVPSRNAGRRGATTALSFTTDDARRIGEAVGIDWETSPFDVEQYRMGLVVELEHGRHDPATNVTDDDELVTGKIALAHLKEFPDYYTRLERMEEEAKAFFAQQTPGA